MTQNERFEELRKMHRNELTATILSGMLSGILSASLVKPEKIITVYIPAASLFADEIIAQCSKSVK